MSLENYHYTNVEEEFDIIRSIYHDNLIIYSSIDDDNLENLILKYYKEYSLDNVDAVISFIFNPLEESQKIPHTHNSTTTVSIELTQANVENGKIYLYILVPKEYPKVCSQCYLHVPKETCYKSDNLKILKNYVATMQSDSDIATLLSLLERYALETLITQATDSTSNIDGGSDSKNNDIVIDGNSSDLVVSQSSSTPNNTELAKVTDFSPESLDSLSDAMIALSLKNTSKPQPFHICKKMDNCATTDKFKDDIDRKFASAECLVHNCDHCSGTIYGKFGSDQLAKVFYFKQYIIDIKSLAQLKLYSITHLNNYVSNVIDEMKNYRKCAHDSILNIHSSSKIFHDEKIYVTHVYDVNLLSFHTMSSLFSSSDSPLGVTEIVIHRYAISMLKALDYLHRNQIYYGKLEPCNVLVSNEGELLLFDVFSFGQLTNIESHLTRNYCPNYLKCRHFSAFSNRLYPVSAKSDVYAYGLILLSLYKGSIVSEYPPSIPNLLPNVIQQYIKRCFKMSEEHPLPTSDLLNDYYTMHFEPMPNIWAGHNPTILSSQSTVPFVDMSAMGMQKQDMEDAMSYYGGMITDVNSTFGTSRVENEFQSFTSIGSGGFGSVISARKKLDSCVYAIKRIKLPRKNPKKLNDILKEVQILSKLNHENIVRYYNCWLGPETKKPIFPQIEGDFDELGNEINSESTSDDSDGSSADATFKNNQKNKTTTQAQEYSTDDNDNEEYLRGRLCQLEEFNNLCASDDDENDDNSVEFYDYANYIDENSSSDDIVFECSSGDLEHYERAISLMKKDEAALDLTTPVTRNRSCSTPDVTERTLTKSDSKTSLSAREGKSLNDYLNVQEKTPRNHFYFYIQMEFCEKKTLYEVIESEELYKKNDRIMKLFRGILEGIAYVHDQGLIHRDLKPGNIFISGGDNPKIGDFGLAKLKSTLKGPSARQSTIEAVHFNTMFAAKNSKLVPSSPSIDHLTTEETTKTADSQLSSSQVTNADVNSKFDLMTSFSSYDNSYDSFVGTFIYNAPELNFKNNNEGKHVKITPKSDVYCLGIVFYEMIHPPFATKLERIMNISALRNDDKFTSSYVFEKTYVHLLNMMLKKDPEQRASARDLLEHHLVPTKLDDCKFVHAINQVLVDKNSQRYKHMLWLMFEKKKQYQPNLTNYNNIHYPCYDFAFLGAKSIAWKCLNRLLDNYIEQMGAITPYLPDAVSDSLVYHQSLFDLSNENHDFLSISKSGDKLSLTTTYIKRLGYYLANMEFSRIPTSTFSLMAGVFNFPNLAIKVDKTSNGAVHEQKLVQKCEFCLSQIVSNDVASINDGLVQVISNSIKFVRLIVQKMAKYTSKFQTLKEKNKKLRFISYSPSSRVIVVLNHLALVGKFLVDNNFPTNLHSDLVHIMTTNKKDQIKSEQFFDLIRHKHLDSVPKNKVYQFLNFRGTLEVFKQLINSKADYDEYINQLESIKHELESCGIDCDVEVEVDLMGGLNLNAGYISFILEIEKTHSINGKKPTDTLALGGLSPVYLHKHISYPLNVSNLSPFVVTTPEILGLPNTTSQDDSIIAYAAVALDPVILLCMYLHREESCIIDDKCASRRLVIFAFVFDNCNNLTVEDRLCADALSQEVMQATDLYVHTLNTYISHGTLGMLKSYYNYLNLKAFVLFDVHTREVKVIFYESNRKVHEQKFNSTTEVVEYLKSRIGGNSGYNLLLSNSFRKDDSNSSDHYNRGNSTTSSTDAPLNPTKKTSTDINFVCILPDRTSTSLRRKYESKASVLVKPYLSMINSECKIMVMLTLLTEEEFCFMATKVSTVNFVVNPNFKKDIDKETSMRFSSGSKARLGVVYNAISDVLDKGSLQKSGKPHVCILYSGSLDRAKLLL